MSESNGQQEPDVALILTRILLGAPSIELLGVRPRIHLKFCCIHLKPKEVCASL
jgi:hypothetical protein